jgi:predicted unusual protein kinase regulating ubiquinone biosynthesis (AarF/ABC1/UbiB family)
VLAELSKLQDRIEPFNTLEARRMIEQELGQPIDVVFSEFSDKPIAAASLAQVGHVGMRRWASAGGVAVDSADALVMDVSEVA